MGAGSSPGSTGPGRGPPEGGPFPGFNQYPSWVQAFAGGKVLESGYIAGWGSDADAGSFQRLNADGAIDTAWTSEVSKAGNGFPFPIAMMPDDTAILTGVFAKIAGVDAPGITAVKKDGTIDSGFVSSVGTGPGPFPGDADYARSRTRTEYEGGALYAYGDFTEWNAKSAGRIVRLANRPAGTGGGSSSSGGGNGGRAGLLATPIAPLRRGNGGQVVTARLVFPEAGRYTLMLGSGKVATAQELATAQGFTSSARVTFRKGSRLGARILTRASSAPVISTKAANAVVNIRALVRKGKMGASPTLRIVRKNSDGTYASQVIRGVGSSLRGRCRGRHPERWRPRPPSSVLAPVRIARTTGRSGAAARGPGARDPARGGG